jgi:DNA-directed RNA polymerase subunit beta
MEIQHQAKRTEHAAPIPNLVELQLDSFRSFLEEGLHELFRSFSPIYDFTGQTAIELVDFTLGEPKHSLEQCRSRDVTFEVPIKAKVRLTSPGQEVIESEVYLGDLPLMTEKGTFVINGAERVVVSQLSRSAGIYFRDSLSNLLEWQFFATLIPSEGPWVDIETDGGAITVRIGQNKKFSIMTLLRALHAFDVASPEGEFVIEFRELVGKTLAEAIIDEVTGEVLLDKGAQVDADAYRNLVKALGGEQAVRTRKTKCLLTGFDLETDSQLLDHFGARVTLSSADFDQTDEDPEARWRYAATDLYDGSGKLIVPAYARIDRDAAKKLIAMGANEVEVLEVHRFIGLSLEMEEAKITDRKSALHDIYHKIRPGDPVTDESAKALLHSMFFDTRRYDLAKVGRHKLNKKHVPAALCAHHHQVRPDRHY